jgi:hypothetical protein
VEYLGDEKVPKKFFAVRVLKVGGPFTCSLFLPVEGRKSEEKFRPKAHSSETNLIPLFTYRCLSLVDQ